MPERAPRVLPSLLGYAAVFTVIAWPWLRAASHAIPVGPMLVAPADARLKTWVLAWVAHALVTPGAHLFDANVSYPAPAQLAGTEHLLSSQLLFAPVFWATQNALLAANAVVLVSYPLAALAMDRLLLALGCGCPTAVLGALTFALGPLRVPGNMQIVQYLNFYLPLVALALLRLRESPRAPAALRLAIVLGLALFSSYYAALMASVLCAIWSIAEWRRPGAGRARFALLTAGVALATFGALLLVSRPYFARPEAAAGETGLYTSDLGLLWEYRDVPGADAVRAALFGNGEPFQSEMVHDSSFWARVTLAILRVLMVGWFGLVPLALAGLGLLALAARGSLGRALALRGLLVAGVAGVLTLGPLQFLLYQPGTLPPLLASLVWPLRFFRVPFRFLVLTGFGTALLAAAGAEAAAGILGGRPARALVAAAAGALLLSRGLAGQGLDEVSAQSLPIYDSVRSAAAAHGAGPLLELPLADRSGHGLEREAMLGSTRHWLPLVSGLTGYPAAHRDLLQSAIDRLPAAEAVHELVDMTHLRWLLLRPSAEWSDAGVREELLRLPEIEIVLERDGWALARVVCPPGRSDVFAAIAAGRVPN